MRESLPEKEYRVGNVPQEVPKIGAKYILALQGAGLILHFGDKSMREHRDIALQLTVPEASVQGGGWYRISKSKLILSDASLRFGGVPKEILEHFIEQLKQVFNVSEVVLEPRVDTEDRKHFGLPPKQS